MEVWKTFGQRPEGERLAKISQYPQYRNQGFINLSETKMMAEGTSYASLIWKMMTRPKNVAPAKELPFVPTDLNKLYRLSLNNPVIIWFGHSSYLICTQEKHILVDPVFCGHASPFSFTTKSFAGSDRFTVNQLPNIDILVLTHDHYDHLDYLTLEGLKAKTSQVYAALGVGAHLIYWGWDPDKIVELGWGENCLPAEGISLTAAPARHFSGRGLIRNKSHWNSYILQSANHRLYLGGDSGYDSHFSDLGKRYGPFDIAILEAGQYNQSWPFIHMMPEETLQAAKDLQANMLLPVHWGKFALALHPWYDPISRISEKAAAMQMPYTSPRIGEPVILNEAYPCDAWWKDC